MKLTIGIKALNEERNIAASISSAVHAARDIGGEVILADSGSADCTIDIARTFSIRILQLANPAERCCGAGAQLAFQEAKGEFFYLLDGDMVLNQNFISAGIAFLEANPGVAGVGGRVREVNAANPEFRIRAASVQNVRHWRPGPVDRLDCGGLYRSAAIRKVGYFADRNLHAFEEFELGARLRADGWTLFRIDQPAVEHFGHQTPGYGLLWRRVRSGYIGAAGEVLRSAIGAKQMPVVLVSLSHIRISAGVMVWWGLLLVSLAESIASPIAGLLALAFLMLGPLALLSFRRRSIELGLYSLAAWNAGAWGLLSGFFRRRVAPMTPLSARDLTASPDGQRIVTSC